MADPLQHFRPGEPFVPRADTLNELVDAARFVHTIRNRPNLDSPGLLRDSGVVLVKNTTASAVARFGILGIDTPIFGPADNLGEFQDNCALKGIAPAATNKGRFVITAERIKAGAIGEAYVQAVTPVKIDKVTESPRAADVKAATTTELKEADDGAAQVLWSETGTGVKWAVVRLGSTPATDLLVKITAHSVVKSLTIAVGGGSSVSVEVIWAYSATEVTPDSATWDSDDKSGGLAFSATGAGGLPKLWNLTEFTTTSGANVAGIDMTQASYPTGNRPRPIGAAGAANTHDRDEIVIVKRTKDSAGNDFYYFVMRNQHDGACT